MIFSTVVGHLLFWACAPRLRTLSWLDLSPFLACYLGQALHGPFSTAYHTFMCVRVLDCGG